MSVSQDVHHIVHEIVPSVGTIVSFLVPSFSSSPPQSLRTLTAKVGSVKEMDGEGGLFGRRTRTLTKGGGRMREKAGGNEAGAEAIAWESEVRFGW